MSTPLANVILRGTRAAQPAASGVCAGSVYYVTDEGKTERSNGTVWQDISDQALLSVVFTPPIQQYAVTGSPLTPASTTIAITNRPLFDNGSVTGATAINFNNGSVQRITLIADITITFSNPINGMEYTLLVGQDSGGSHLATWPAAVKWSGGSLTLTSTPLKTDVLKLVYDGTNYYQTAVNFEC